MGDTLRPSRRLDQQTDEEYALMCALFPHTARTHRNKR